MHSRGRGPLSIFDNLVVVKWHLAGGPDRCIEVVCRCWFSGRLESRRLPPGAIPGAAGGFLGAIVAHGSDGGEPARKCGEPDDPYSMAWIGTWPLGGVFFGGRRRGEGVLDSCGQAIKGTWGMSWRQEALKGVEDCEKPGGVVKRALIPGFPNWRALNP